MKEFKLLGGGNCVRRLLLETALLPPPIRRGRWGRPDVTGRPRCTRGASLSWRRDGTASFITRIRVFLTAAHLVPKCLLVACELPPKRGVSSEPCAELVPSVFCVEAFFFHEYGRHVGMMPRSSLKEGKYNQMVEKRTKTTQQQTKQNQPQPTGRDSTTK